MAQMMYNRTMGISQKMPKFYGAKRGFFARLLGLFSKKPARHDPLISWLYAKNRLEEDDVKSSGK